MNLTIIELTDKMQHGTRKLPPQGKKPNAWTREEDAILIEHYRNGGVAEVMKRTSRSKKGIVMRAMHLGIQTRKAAVKWTPADDAVVREHYEANGGAYVSQLTGKSVLAVRHRARRLGVNADKSRAGKERRKVQLAKVREHRHGPKMTVVKQTQIKAVTLKGEPIITAATKITIAEPFVDKRWIPDHVPSVVDSGNCRAWAKVAR